MTPVHKPTREEKRVQSRLRGTIKLFAFAAVPIGILGLSILYAERRPETSPLTRGARLATTSGCFACHAPAEGEHRVNFRQVSPGTWKPKSIPTLTENGIDDAEVLTDWITNGAPAKEAERHKQLFIRMPAYRGFLKAEEIDAICAWILSEGIRISQSAAAAAPAETAATDVAATGTLTDDQLYIAGDQLSRRVGCYQCHGELGQGGVANPASFKGYMPGFFGSDFAELTDGAKRTEVLYWIDAGRGRAIERGAMGRVAKHFLETQAIQMPPYRERLTATEKEILADYVLLLHKEGPLTAKKLERIAHLLNEDVSK
jgi:mono/diheme cytochrome c family protein